MDLNTQDGSAQTPKAIYLKDYTPPVYLIDNVDLEFKLAANKTVVTNTMQMRRNDGQAENAALVLDGQLLVLISVQMDGRSLAADEYTLTDETLTIADVPKAFTLQIINEIHPDKNTALEGLMPPAVCYVPSVRRRVLDA